MSAMHPVFTPTALDPQQLDDITVGRVDLLDRLVTRIRQAATSGTRAHTLVVGPRGSGKTHLFAVALHRARREPEVADRLAVAWVPEDAMAIGSYPDLLVELIRQLDRSSLDEAVRLRRQGESTALEGLMVRALDSRALVVLLENLDRVFAALGRPGTSAFRGFVESDTNTVILASTPLLFGGVSSRDEPWYGSFDIERLDDLSLAEGTELLRHRAVARGDQELVVFVQSPVGQTRLRAIEHLAGGSPRLWHILADAVTVASLDALIPAVEKLMDDLAPYYQQRLWELPANEQKLVVEIARGIGSRNVDDLAASTGIPERAAASALGRLIDSKWVRREKVPGTDQRRSWYDLREPLLRHHLQFRESRGEPLRLIVDFLRVWYSTTERQRFLADAMSGSHAERVLALSFRDEPARFDSAWASRDVDELLAEARRWRFGTSRSSITGSSDLASALEAIVIAARGNAVTADGAVARVAAEVGRAGGPVADRVEVGILGLAGLNWGASDSRVLRAMGACWTGHRDPDRARRTLGQLVEEVDPVSPEGLGFRSEVAFWTGEVGDVVGARDLYAVLVADYVRVLGADHPDTLMARSHLASRTGEAGDVVGARDLFAVLVADRVRVLGADHPDTLMARHGLAYRTGEAGDVVGARDLFAVLVADYVRVLGADHPHTLMARSHLASRTGEAGDVVGARDLFAVLVADYVRVLGADHPHTLLSQRNLAYWTRQVGDGRRLVDKYRSLLARYPEGGLPDSAYGLARDALTAALTGTVPLSEWNLPASILMQFGPIVARASRIRTDRGRELLQAVDRDTGRLVVLGQLFALGPNERHSDLLTALGYSSPEVELVARALDDEPDALVALPAELRSLVELQSKAPDRDE